MRLPRERGRESTRATEGGVLSNATGPATVRLVTHLDVDRTQIERAIEILTAAAAGG